MYLPATAFGWHKGTALVLKEGYSIALLVE